LRTLLLLTAAIAVWIAHAKNRHDNDKFTTQIAAMRPLAHELVIADPEQIAVVKQDERWYDQNDWKIYLPEGSYVLNLASREITEDKLVTPAKSVPITAGQHHLAVDQKRNADGSSQVTVAVDGEVLMTIDEPAGWDPGHGSSGGGHFSTSTQLPPKEPLILFRRRFTELTPTGTYSAPAGPSNGLLLWIVPAQKVSSP